MLTLNQFDTDIETMPTLPLRNIPVVYTAQCQACRMGRDLSVASNRETFTISDSLACSNAAQQEYTNLSASLSRPPEAGFFVVS